MARNKLKLKKGDRVIVISGRDKGRKGEVLKVMPDERRALVQGVNLVKRHQRPTQAQPGGIDEKEAPVHLSNLALEDPKSGEASRIGYRFLDDGRKVRYAKRSGEIIDL